MLDDYPDDVSFEEAVRLDALRRDLRSLRGLLLEAQHLSRTRVADRGAASQQELAIRLLSHLDDEDAIARDVAIFILRNSGHRCFRLAPEHGLAPDLDYFAGRDVATPELLSSTTRAIYHLEQVVAGSDPGPSGWRVILDDVEHASVLDEALDRGVTLPSDVLDDYLRGRLGEHSDDPLAYETVWPGAPELSELLLELSAGSLEGLPRLIELQATEWAESLRAWASSAQQSLPPRDLLRRRGLWRALAGELSPLSQQDLEHAVQLDADTRDFALWSAKRTCRAHLWTHEWDAAVRTANDIRCTPCLGDSTCDAHAWAASAVTIACLAEEDFAGALQAAKDECREPLNSSSADTRRVNLELLEEWQRTPGVYRTTDLISPYTLLGREEGAVDMSTARMDQLRGLGRNGDALLTINVADERLRGAHKDYAGVDAWVRLPSTSDPDPMDGLTWSVPRLTPRIGESELEVRRRRAWTALKDALRDAVQVRLEQEWHTWTDVTTDGGLRD